MTTTQQDSSLQRACSQCKKSLCGGGIWCAICGYVHVKCSGLLAKKNWYPDFVCSRCSEPDIGQEGSSGLSQALQGLSLDDNQPAAACTIHQAAACAVQPAAACAIQPAACAIQPAAAGTTSNQPTTMRRVQQDDQDQHQ